MKKIWMLLAIGLALGWSDRGQSATVHNCTAEGHQCVVKVEEGIIGDKVRFLDEKARVIALGRIIKKRGNYALISVSNAVKHIRRGYPVIIDLENRDSAVQWTAAFSGE